MTEKRFYVYLHKRADNGVVFYVGKGTGRRAWALYNRSKRWKEKAKHGVIVEIHTNNMTECDANNLELYLIQNPEYTWELTNIRKENYIKEVSTDIINLLEYSETSPSGLIWKNQFK